MDYTFIHPLYTKGDEELAIAHITEYLQNNNRPEYDAININHEPFTIAPPLIPKEQTESIALMQYGKNIISIANVLKMQDVFFKDYMPHICRYLDILNIDHYASYMRISQIIPTYMVHLFVSGKRTTPFKYWNPQVEWVDFSYTKDIEANLTNPINNFYSGGISIKNIYNDDFIKEIGNIYYTNLERVDKNQPSTLHLKLIPALNPIRMIKVTEAIHKYL